MSGASTLQRFSLEVGSTLPGVAPPPPPAMRRRNVGSENTDVEGEELPPPPPEPVFIQPELEFLDELWMIIMSGAPRPRHHGRRRRYRKKIGTSRSASS